jgi:hypothetical protein
VRISTAKEHEKQPQTSNRWISQTVGRIDPKFWVDKKRHYVKLCPISWNPKPIQSTGITNLVHSKDKPDFIQSSPNQARLPAFEGSRSSPKVRKTSIHDPLKEIRSQTTYKRRIEPSTKKAQKELRKSNKRNSGIERLAQDLEDEFTMNILSKSITSHS